MQGTITDNGVISLNSTNPNGVYSSSSSQQTRLYVNGQVTLTGSGALELGDNVQNRVIGIGTDPLLVNAAGHTIRGGGSLGDSSDYYGYAPGTLALTNYGLIDATTPTRLDLSLSSGINAGTMQASNGGTLLLSYGTLDNQGTLKVASGGTMVIASNLKNYASGTLTGGSYNVAGVMALPVPTSETIQTNAAKVILDGPSAAIIKYAENSNALAGFTSNTAMGDFTIKNGANFATAGTLTMQGQ